MRDPAAKTSRRSAGVSCLAAHQQSRSGPNRGGRKPGAIRRCRRHSVVVSHPLGDAFIDIATTGGIVVARHRMAADGLGITVRDSGHVIALDTAAMAAAHSGRPHRRKERIPPGPAAKAAAVQLLALPTSSTSTDQTSTTTTDSTVVDLPVVRCGPASNTTHEFLTGRSSFLTVS